MSTSDDVRSRTPWGQLRFAIIGPLLAAPPASYGEMRRRLEELAKTKWTHPKTGEKVCFGRSTIEKWYYRVRDAQQPIACLERKVHAQAGRHPSITSAVAAALSKQYSDHPRWSYQLHYDNLLAVADADPSVGAVPSYSTVRRFMKDRGMVRLRRLPRCCSKEVQPRELRETRSYEAAHVHALWHCDFHHGSLRVLLPSGEWRTPILFGVIDDYSRLCCHLQWYLEETAAALIHGLCQAIQKRGLPRALLRDNGPAMIAAETCEGLERLSIVDYTTLPYSPEQNAKQEVFWAAVEGRLMAMLEGHAALTLDLLNEATQAWVELEYHRQTHSELKQSPLDRYLRGPSVGRDSPSSDELRRAFCTELSRTQRRSDGTITIDGVRFEIPSAYRAISRPTVRVARWDLSVAELVDHRTGAHLATLRPLDKQKNADGRRRVRTPLPSDDLGSVSPNSEIAPRLRALMAEYSATGLPPAYLKDPNPGQAPQREHDHDGNQQNDHGTTE